MKFGIASRILQEEIYKRSNSGMTATALSFLPLSPLTWIPSYLSSFVERYVGIQPIADSVTGASFLTSSVCPLYQLH